MGRLCCSRYEREARQCGWLRIAGLDEAGRGSLFGPVVAAAVILNPRRRIVGLDDSKKLSAERREELAARICEHAIAWATAEVDSTRIDAWNIYQASRQAMTAALQQLAMQPDYFLVLPWHFRDGIVRREAEFLARGGRMIFPFPEIEIV